MYVACGAYGAMAALTGIAADVGDRYEFWCGVEAGFWAGRVWCGVVVGAVAPEPQVEHVSQAAGAE